MDMTKLLYEYQNSYHTSAKRLEEIWSQLKSEKNKITLYAEDENILSVIIPLLEYLEIKVSFLVTDNTKLYNTRSRYGLVWEPVKEDYESSKNNYWIPGYWWNTDAVQSSNCPMNHKEVSVNLLIDLFIQFLPDKYFEFFDLCTDKNIDNFFAASLPKYNKMTLQKGDYNKKYAVYTCIVGDYDAFYEPTNISDDCDYYLISDQKPQKLNHVKWIDIKDVVPKELTDKVEMSRWPKMHPHIIFKDYEYSIYMDGCYCVIGDVRSLLHFGNTGISIFHHPYRKCIYTEALVLAACKKGKAEEIKKQISRYQAEGMPASFGLYENCMIVRQHHKKTCIELMEAWWNEFHAESKRDQLSLPYVVWKSGFHFEDIGILGNNVLDCNVLHKYNHYAKDILIYQGWLFPYELVEQGSRIVLYGAGEVGKDFYNQVKASEHCKVVLWIDRKFEQYQHLNMPVVSPEKVLKAQFDYILICNAVKPIAEEMKRYLINLGISKERVISPDNLHKETIN